MDEIRNYHEPAIPQPPAADVHVASWWEGELHGDDENRPITTEYVPIWYNPQTNDPNTYKWVAVVARWARHVPLQPQPWNHFVMNTDANILFDEWMELPSGEYQIFRQYVRNPDGSDAGAIAICPHLTQINTVSLGEQLFVHGSGQVNIGNFARLADGYWYLGPDSHFVDNGDRTGFWEIKVGEKRWRLGATEVP
jgi:hypothetical protein